MPLGKNNTTGQGEKTSLAPQSPQRRNTSSGSAAFRGFSADFVSGPSPERRKNPAGKSSQGSRRNNGPAGGRTGSSAPGEVRGGSSHHGEQSYISRSPSRAASRAAQRGQSRGNKSFRNAVLTFGIISQLIERSGASVPDYAEDKFRANPNTPFEFYTPVQTNSLTGAAVNSTGVGGASGYSSVVQFANLATHSNVSFSPTGVLSFTVPGSAPQFFQIRGLRYNPSDSQYEVDPNYQNPKFQNLYSDSSQFPHVVLDVEATYASGQHLNAHGIRSALRNYGGKLNNIVTAVPPGYSDVMSIQEGEVVAGDNAAITGLRNPIDLTVAGAGVSVSANSGYLSGSLELRNSNTSKFSPNAANRGVLLSGELDGAVTTTRSGNHSNLLKISNRNPAVITPEDRAADQSVSLSGFNRGATSFGIPPYSSANLVHISAPTQGQLNSAASSSLYNSITIDTSTGIGDVTLPAGKSMVFQWSHGPIVGTNFTLQSPPPAPGVQPIIWKIVSQSDAHPHNIAGPNAGNIFDSTPGQIIDPTTFDQAASGLSNDENSLIGLVPGTRAVLSLNTGLGMALELARGVQIETDRTTQTTTDTTTGTTTETTTATTTNPTTGTTTRTTTETSTRSTSPTTTEETTQTTSVTSSATSSPTTTVSTSVTVTDTSSPTSSVTATETSSITSSATTSPVTTQTSTITSTDTSTGTTTEETTVTTTPSTSASTSPTSTEASSPTTTTITRTSTPTTTATTSKTTSVSSTGTTTVTTTRSNTDTSTGTSTATTTAVTTPTSSATSTPTSTEVTVVHTTPNSTITSTRTTTPTSTETTRVTSTPTSTKTSTATSSVSASGTTTATTSESTTEQTSPTTSQTTTNTETETSSATTSPTTTKESTVTTTNTQTGETSQTSTVTSTDSSTGTSTVSSTMTSSNPTSPTTSETTSFTTTQTSSPGTTPTTTDTTTKATTVTTSATTSETTAETSTVSSTGTSSQTNSVTTTASSSPTTSQSTTEATTVTSTGTSSPTTTHSTTVTQSDTSTGTSTASSTPSTTGTSSATVTATSSATSTPTTIVISHDEHPEGPRGGAGGGKNNDGAIIAATLSVVALTALALAALACRKRNRGAAQGDAVEFINPVFENPNIRHEEGRDLFNSTYEPLGEDGPDNTYMDVDPPSNMRNQASINEYLAVDGGLGGNNVSGYMDFYPDSDHTVDLTTEEPLYPGDSIADRGNQGDESIYATIPESKVGDGPLFSDYIDGRAKNTGRGAAGGAAAATEMSDLSKKDHQVFDASAPGFYRKVNDGDSELGSRVAETSFSTAGNIISPLRPPPARTFQRKRDRRGISDTVRDGEGVGAPPAVQARPRTEIPPEVAKALSDAKKVLQESSL